MSTTRGICTGVSSHKMLTTNWLMQELHQVSEATIGLTTAAGGIYFTKYPMQNNILGLNDSTFLGNAVPGLEMGLGAFSLTRGLCQLWNTYHFDENTATQVSNPSGSSVTPITFSNRVDLKIEAYIKGILELIKGGFLIRYGYEGFIHYYHGISTLSQVIHIAMTGYFIAAAIDTAVAVWNLAAAWKRHHGIDSAETKKEFLNLIIQGIKLAGVFLLFTSHPLGWVLLATAYACHLLAVGKDLNQGNLCSSIGYFKRPPTSYDSMGSPAFNTVDTKRCYAPSRESLNIMRPMTGRL